MRHSVRVAGAAAVLAAILVGGLLAATPQTATADKGGRVVRAAVHGPGGEHLGTVRLAQAGGKVWVVARLQGLTPGFHGFHVHQVGRCEPPGFQSAGGHYNPDAEGHGDHAGDLPSLLVTGDGRAELAFATDAFTVAELVEGDGSAIMVHSGADNFANIPDRYRSSAQAAPGPDAETLATGDSGGRVGCGVVGG